MQSNFQAYEPRSPRGSNKPKIKGSHNLSDVLIDWLLICGALLGLVLSSTLLLSLIAK